jgi:sec-independent protein translocase protein TatA
VQLGPAEILVVLVIALLVFGPTKLPEVGRQVGRAMKEFRQFQQTMSRDLHDVFSDDATAAAEPAPTLPPKATVPDVDVIDVEARAESPTEVPPQPPATPNGEASSEVSRSSPGESTADPEASA